MDPQRQGRWAIVLTEGDPPVFWSYDRSAIEDACRIIRRRCPDAQIVWVDGRADTHRKQEDVPETR